MEISNVQNETESSGVLTLVSHVWSPKKIVLKYAQGNNIREVEYDGIYGIGDVLKITHLVFYSYLKLEEFKNAINNSFFKIKLENETFMKIPLMFLIFLNEIVCSNNNEINSIQKYYIKFPDFLFEIISVATNVAQKNFKISCKLENEIKCTLLVNILYLDFKERQKLSSNKFSKLAQSLNVVDEKIISNKNPCVKVFKIYTDLYTKGYFVYGKNVLNIKCLTLKVCDKYIIKYDKDMIQLFCKKINSNVLYVPYNFEKKYYHMTIDSYIGAMNDNSTHSSANITIEFDSAKNTECGILSLGLDYLNYDFNLSFVKNSNCAMFPITLNYCLEKQFSNPPIDCDELLFLK